MSRSSVIVKKPLGERIWISAITIFVLVIVIMCVANMGTPIALLLFTPIFLILLPLVIFSLTWQLRFEKEQIIMIFCFCKVKVYTYAQLQDITQQYFTSEHGSTIRMNFIDGKVIRFRIGDDGAKQAIKLLCKHRSIQNK